MKDTVRKDNDKLLPAFRGCEVCYSQLRRTSPKESSFSDMSIEPDNLQLFLVDSVVVLVRLSLSVIFFHENFLSSLKHRETFDVLWVQKVMLLIGMLSFYFQNVDSICAVAIDINSFFKDLVFECVNFILRFESQQESDFWDLINEDVVGLSLKDDSILIDPL